MQGYGWGTTGLAGTRENIRTIQVSCQRGISTSRWSLQVCDFNHYVLHLPSVLGCLWCDRAHKRNMRILAWPSARRRGKEWALGMVGLAAGAWAQHLHNGNKMKHICIGICSAKSVHVTQPLRLRNLFLRADPPAILGYPPRSDWGEFPWQRDGRGLSIGGESRKFPGRSAANGAPRMNAATLSYGAKNRSWRSKAFFAFGSRFSENQLATYKLRLHYMYTSTRTCIYNEAVICTCKLTSCYNEAVICKLTCVYTTVILTSSCYNEAVICIHNEAVICNCRRQ